ncbi:MAG: PAS domain S-box protein [Bryobacteraceae bacterium]|nr:PAS domain S-box protein [Bryobacteraceae bacterium]
MSNTEIQTGEQPPGGAFRDMPIKRKLMVIVMATTTAALIVAGAGVVWFDSLVFRDYLQRDLSVLGRIIADASAAALAFDDPKTAAETLAALQARTHLRSACIYRIEGPLFASYARSGEAVKCPQAAPADRVRWTPDELMVARTIRLQDRELGTLAFFYDLDEIGRRRNSYSAIVLCVLVASGFLAFLLSSRLRAVIATPIAQLVNATSAVSRTKDYSIRARKLSADELGVLADAVNDMLAGIQSRDRELREALADREQALNDARNARDSLATTLASIGDAVISTDAEGRILFLNPVAESLMRWPAAEAVGKPIEDVFRIVNEYTRETVESPVRRVLREGAIVGLANSTMLLARDGTEIPIDDSGAPIRDRDGTILGTVLVFRDVTARRRAEETSHLLAAIVESSDEAIISANLNGIVMSWNRGAERIFGYSAEEMIGRSISVMAPPGRVDEMIAILARIRSGERIEELQTLRRARHGGLVNVSLTVSPLRDASGAVVGVSKIARDITERVRSAERLALLNADLQRSNQRLASSNEDLERFAFIASHDLQEPLRMITTYSQLLARNYPDALDGNAGMCVRNIMESAQRMRELIADLLAYTEITARQDEPVEAVDLNGVVEKAMQNLKASIDETGAVVTCDPLPSLTAREAHFLPLFQNLIGNAIKYRGEQPPRIHISARDVEGQLQFSVKDNGIGIDPQYHERIFVAFKRLHGKKIPGTGIGLAICQRVLERYGGRIWVESQVGEGATFLFTLPDMAAQKARRA